MTENQGIVELQERRNNLESRFSDWWGDKEEGSRMFQGAVTKVQTQFHPLLLIKNILENEK